MVRANIQLKFWFCHSFSQGGQDNFIDQVIFKSKLRDGFFIEAGADDLMTDSNTLFFELERGWTGILVEPLLWQKRWNKSRGQIFPQERNKAERLVCPSLPWTSSKTPFCTVHKQSHRRGNGWSGGWGGRGNKRVPVFPPCQVPGFPQHKFPLARLTRKILICFSTSNSQAPYCQS